VLRLKVKSLHTPIPHPLSPQRVVWTASLCALLGSLDTSVNIAFPSITQEFGLEVTMIQWVVVSYVLTYASLLLSFGRLADMWGHGRVFGRVLQGVSVALVFAAVPALVTLSVPSEERGRALGIFQMSTAVGFALGPLLGGVLVEGFGWRAVYLFRVLPALLLALLVAGQSNLARLGQEYRDGNRFDLLGALTLAGSVAGLLLAVNRGRDLGWTSPLVLSLALGASGCLAGFLITEARVSAPVVDISLFRRPAFTIANLLNVLANCAMFAIWLLVPFYLVNVLRYPAILGGVLLMLNPLVTALAAPLAGKLSDRLGTSRLSTLGLGVEALGLLMISRLNAGSDYVPVALALGLVGLGLGIFQVPNMSFVMGAIPRAQQGVAGSMSKMMRTLGIILGVTSASMLFDTRRTVHTGHALSQGASDLQSFIPAFQDVFVVSAILCLMAFGLSLLSGRESLTRGADST
jgi:EmrB/QacA subfamily drug resistance transporter